MNSGFLSLPFLDEIPGIRHALTTRHGPAFGKHGTDAATAAAMEECSRHLGLAGAAWPHQVHGGTVLKVKRPGLAGQADALCSDTPKLLLAGRSADCPIVLVAGRQADDRPVVGFAHASWRSTLRRITGELVGVMTGELSAVPGTLHAVIAPSAGPCCYEVGPEVREAALAALGPGSAAFFRGRNFDLWAANLAQLEAAGVPAAQIHVLGICTICRGEDFWSWRVQGEAAGRFAGLIGIAPS